VIAVAGSHDAIGIAGFQRLSLSASVNLASPAAILKTNGSTSEDGKNVHSGSDALGTLAFGASWIVRRFPTIIRMEGFSGRALITW
jgi:hypothetical protein